jgi:hypothetical protein
LQAVASNFVLELSFLWEGGEVTHDGKRLPKAFVEHYLKTQGVDLKDYGAESRDGLAVDALAIKDDASGISVEVKADEQTLVATDAKGKVLWQADVIKLAGAPGVGKPVVRHLSIKKGRVTAVYGKHSFAELDLHTGKLISSGSD